MSVRKALLCVVFLALSTAQAQAHAYVVQTAPVTNGTVATSPAEVTVTFDEPVEIESRRALIVQGDGPPAVCVGGAKLDPDDETRVVCKLAAPLEHGAYTVNWRVTSADTHVVHGVYSFGVGIAVNAPAEETGSIYDPSGLPATVLRWLTFLGLAMLAGSMIFDRFVLRDGAFGLAAQYAVERVRNRCATLRLAGVLLAIAAGAASLDVQAAAATGTDVLGAVPALVSIAVGSTWGLAWLVRMCGLCAMLVAARRRPSFVGLGVCAILLLTISVSGHAAANGHVLQSIVPVALDWAHLGGAVVWSGGLIVFATALRPASAVIARDERGEFVRTAVALFSPIALVCVGAIVVSGVYATVVHVDTLELLVGSPYGRVVLAKIALLLPLAILGYRHYRQGGTDGVRVDFATTVTCEAVVIAAVLVLSAILNGLVPPFPNGGHT